MYLAFDASTAACTAALLQADGMIVGHVDEVIGRGHAERLVPMIADLAGGHVPTRILVGVGPGSFTGIRVAIAAAHGLALGWNVPLCGFDSLALLAAGAPGDGPVAVAVNGGHGELFVRRFARRPLAPLSDTASLRPEAAAAAIAESLVVGSGAAALVEARGSGEAIDMLPSAIHALSLPDALRSLEARPSYGRAPDARPRAA
jgi:tRNA threonylcarbamoyl adenosine modification protein YeaZ